MFKRVFLMLALLMPAQQWCQDPQQFPAFEQEQITYPIAEPEQEISALGYYSSHLMTALVARFVMEGLFLAVKKDNLSNNLGITVSADLSKGLELCTHLANIYVFYKVPQWTDTTLGVKTERSFLGNIFSFFMRGELGYPVGVLTSEYFIRNTK